MKLNTAPLYMNHGDAPYRMAPRTPKVRDFPSKRISAYMASMVKSIFTMLKATFHATTETAFPPAAETRVFTNIWR